MLPLLRSLVRHRRLLRDFIGRDLKARYVGSAMGFFWSIIFPILNLAIYTFVFSIVLGMRWGSDAPQGITVLRILAGILAWTAFAETVSRGTNCLVEHANLIQKVRFPSEILAPFLTLSSLFNMAIGLPIVILGVILVGPDEKNGGVALGLPLVLVPVLVVLQAIFTTGLCYILSTINLYLRDTYHVIGVLIMLWMFSTPIFYPEWMLDPDLTPEGDLIPIGRKDFGWLLRVNPMYWLIRSYRDVMIDGAWPAPVMLVSFATVSVLVFCVGSTLFQARKREIPDLL